MKFIRKNQSAACRSAIQDFIRDKKSRSERAHYDDFQDKQLLRLSLLKEQGYLCAYCMQRVVDNPLYTKIEHWKTRESYNKENDSEGTLDYQNLLAVCIGKTNGDDHCDTERSKKNPTLTVNPTENRLISQITYLKNGKIESTNAAIELDVNQHLNLNCLQLQDNRKKVLNDLWKIFEIKCKGKSFEQSESIKSQIVQGFLSKKDDRFQPYCGIVAYVYRKYL